MTEGGNKAYAVWAASGGASQRAVPTNCGNLVRGATGSSRTSRGSTLPGRSNPRERKVIVTNLDRQKVAADVAPKLICGQ